MKQLIEHEAEFMVKCLQFTLLLIKQRSPSDSDYRVYDNGAL